MPRHHPHQGPASRHRWTLLALSALSLLASVGFVLAPVEQPEAVYSWPGTSGDATAVAIPLMLGRPVQLEAAVGCATARAAEPGTALLTTAPPGQIRGEAPFEGLRVAVEDGELRVRTGGTDLPPQPIPADDDCTWTLSSTSAGTVLARDGETVVEEGTDLRPWVAGVFTEATTPDDLSVTVTADTVFQTTPTPLRTSLAVVAVLALLGALLLGARRERAARAPAPAPGSAAGDGGTARVPVDGPAPAGHRMGPVRWLIDAGVVALLALWTLIGPLTVDDGYISGIIRSRDENGYVGNVYRWFNAPEAPFGWFYELMNAWSAVSTSTAWLRIPSSLLGVATWLLIARCLLPRLGSYATGGIAPYAVAAVTFAAWWLPSNLGLRPEAWVAVGLAAVLVLVERGIARERALPVLVALAVAGATLAATPTGAVAFLPFLAAAVPLLHLARRSPFGPLTVTVLATAAAASALLLMFADQSLAGIVRANEIRNELPGAVPWSTEAERWYLLLTAGELQGSLSRRVPVLLTVVAAVGIVWRLVSARWPGDAARPVAIRLVTVFGLSLVVFLFTPTKWTMHFGALVPVGVALIVLGVHLFGRALDRDPATVSAGARGGRSASVTRVTSGVSVVLFVAAWSYSGWNQWAYLSNNDVPWNDMPPQLSGIPFSSVFLTGAVVVALAGAATAIWAQVWGGRRTEPVRTTWLPSPGLVAVGLIALTVALEVASFAKSTWERRDTFSMGTDAAAAIEGRGCGLAERLRVEPRPLAGLLRPSDARTEDGEGPVLDGFVEVDGGDTPSGPALTMGGEDLPGWAATGHTTADGRAPARLVTGWFELPAPLGAEPLVVTTTGSRAVGTNLIAEFGRVDGDVVTPIGALGVPAGTGTGARDGRVDPAAVPADAEVVRLIATDGGPDTDLPMSVSVPRVPATVPFQEVVDPGTPAIVDWPVAFVFPCQELAVQRNGITDVPAWRIASVSDAGDIIVAGFVGGPYTAARTLVDEVELPVYVEGRPLERPVTLYAWEPRVRTEAPRSTVEPVTRPGWAG